MIKVFLFILACSLCLVGLTCLTFPFAIGMNAIKGNGFDWLMSGLALIFLFLAILCITLGVSYLKRPNEHTARSMAHVCGVALWIFINGEATEFLQARDNSHDLFANWSALLLPIVIAVVFTKILKFFIGRSFAREKQPSEDLETPVPST